MWPQEWRVRGRRHARACRVSIQDVGQGHSREEASEQGGVEAHGGVGGAKGLGFDAIRVVTPRSGRSAWRNRRRDWRGYVKWRSGNARCGSTIDCTM